MRYTYGYDQLNRLKVARQHGTASTWNNASATQSYRQTFDYDGNGNILALMRKKQGTTVMDSLKYDYNRDAAGRLMNNRLTAVNDFVDSGESGELKGTGGYSYDAIGNLTADTREGISLIDWNVYGKIKSIAKTGSTISYVYDASGNRVGKTVTTASPASSRTTWYVRDAQGNQLAVYDNAETNIKWKEQAIYGSSRLGMWKPNFKLATDSAAAAWNNGGLKFFELSNHLGNVMSVITDNRDVVATDISPTVADAQDYYAFGGMMPGRSMAASYRYGFNGKENDNEVKGEGNQQDYGMRIYDPRIAKFLSVDPITADYPELTPYQFASNRPIDGIDRDGLEHERSVGGSAPDYSLFNLFLPKKKKLSLAQTEAMREANQKGLALGSFIGLTTALTVAYTPAVAQWLITPHGSMTATSALWGVLTNEDMPGGVDDLTRLARKSVADILERSSSKFNGIGSVGDGIDNLLRGNKSLKESFHDGLYRIVEAEKDMTVYRVSGGTSEAGTGEFFSTLKPTSSKEAEKLLNIEKWGNTGEKVTPVTIKKGTQFAIGKVAGGDGGQIFIPTAMQNSGGNKIVRDLSKTEELK